MIEYLGKIEVRKYFKLLLGEPDVFDLCNTVEVENLMTQRMLYLYFANNNFQIV